MEDAADQVNAKVESELAGAVFWEVQRAASE